MSEREKKKTAPDLVVVVQVEVMRGAQNLGTQYTSLTISGEGGLEMVVNNLAETQQVVADAASKTAQAAVFLAAARVRQEIREQEQQAQQDEGKGKLPGGPH